MCSGHQLNLLGMRLKILNINILRILILSIHVYYNVQLITLDDIHFYSSGITWSKWTSLCSKISGSEEFNNSIATGH